MQIEKGVDKIVKTIRLMILDQRATWVAWPPRSAMPAATSRICTWSRTGSSTNTRDLTLFIDDEAQLQGGAGRDRQGRGRDHLRDHRPGSGDAPGRQDPGQEPGSARRPGNPAQDLHAGRGQGVQADRADARAEVRIHRDRKHGGHRHQWHGHSGPGRHRGQWPACL